MRGRALAKIKIANVPQRLKARNSRRPARRNVERLSEMPAVRPVIRPCLTGGGRLTRRDWEVSRYSTRTP